MAIFEIPCRGKKWPRLSTVVQYCFSHAGKSGPALHYSKNAYCHLTLKVRGSLHFGPKSDFRVHVVRLIDFTFFYDIIVTSLAPLRQISKAPNLINNIEHLYYKCPLEDVKWQKCNWATHSRTPPYDSWHLREMSSGQINHPFMYILQFPSLIL